MLLGTTDCFAHMLYFLGTPFTEPAACLKHLTKTFIEVTYCVSKWFKFESKDEGINSIRDTLMSPLISMMIDSATEHVIDQTNALCKLLMGSLEGEQFQRMLQSHVLSICDYALMQEHNKEEGYAFLLRLWYKSSNKYIIVKFDVYIISLTHGFLPGKYLGKGPNRIVISIRVVFLRFFDRLWGRQS